MTVKLAVADATISKASVSVYERLREMIIRGRLAPGVRVVEGDVAERLGVSRTPAREAIQRLFQDGLLVPTGSPTRTQLAVSALTVEDMVDVYGIMAALEGTAVRAVAEFSQSERRSLAAAMRAANDQFEAALVETRLDYDTLFDLHNEFHAVMLRATASARLQSLIDVVRPQIDRYEFVYAPLVSPTFDDTIAEHAGMVRAIREGSANAAESAVRANWLNSAKRLRDPMARAGPRGDW
ncbi:MAG: GntR family transcriptional regulator [Gemmatimonadaceae bacterium]